MSVREPLVRLQNCVVVGRTWMVRSKERIRSALLPVVLPVPLKCDLRSSNARCRPPTHVRCGRRPPTVAVETLLENGRVCTDRALGLDRLTWSRGPRAADNTTFSRQRLRREPVRQSRALRRSRTASGDPAEAATAPLTRSCFENTEIARTSLLAGLWCGPVTSARGIFTRADDLVRSSSRRRTPTTVCCRP